MVTPPLGTELSAGVVVHRTSLGPSVPLYLARGAYDACHLGPSALHSRAAALRMHVTRFGDQSRWLDLGWHILIRCVQELVTALLSPVSVADGSDRYCGMALLAVLVPAPTLLTVRCIGLELRSCPSVIRKSKSVIEASTAEPALRQGADQVEPC